MAISNPPTKQLTDLELMAHLYRRAGFGATREELEAATADGYEAAVAKLLYPEKAPDLDDELIFRYYPEFHEGREIQITQAHWVYRMINTRRPLEEKLALFWVSAQSGTVGRSRGRAGPEDWRAKTARNAGSGRCGRIGSGGEGT
jgi:hypothetical protein